MKRRILFGCGVQMVHGLAWLRFAGFGALALVAGAAAATATTGGCGLSRSGSLPEGSTTSTGAGGDDGCPQCPQGTGECQVPTCSDGCGLLNVEAGTACSEDGGNVCDGAGDCVECTEEAQCPGNELVCDVLAHLCVPIDCLNGELDRDETDIDCGGDCAPCQNGEDCVLAEDCASGFCDDQGQGGGGGGGSGTPVCAPCTAHAQCDVASYCDPAVEGGSCVDDKPISNECDEPEECETANCADGYCCDLACAGGCDFCNGATVGTCDASSDGDPSDGTCGAFLCDGGAACPSTCVDDGDCDSMGYCDIDDFMCYAPDLIQGAPCDHDNECATGACVDGVCCENSCATLCEACSLAKNGVADGSCAPVILITDPDNECVNGACNGSNDCDLNQGQACPGGNSDCLNNICRDGFCCNNVCMTLCTACSNAKTGGVNGTCLAVTLQTDPDAECANGACNGANDCDVDQGQPCPMGNSDCLNNTCRDGVCCENACGTMCEACSNAKTGGMNGLCLPVTPNTDPDMECANGACNGSNDCDLDQGQACPVGDSDCLNDTCRDGFCCENDCAGLCEACSNTKTGGMNGQCEFITMGTDPDEDCTVPNDNECCNGAGVCGGSDPSCNN